MKIVSYENRTDAYIGTFVKDAKDDMEQLASIRRMVINLNKDLKAFGYEYRYYVKCQGRGARRRGDRNYLHSLPLKFADKMDAYIYRRMRGENFHN
jgi:hypothetical protein